MKRPLHLVLAVVILLTGCSTPPTSPTPGPSPDPPPRQETPAPVSAPPPRSELPDAPALKQTPDGLLVQGVWQSPLWFAGGNRIALFNDAGLWSLSPVGDPVELLAPPGPDRTLIGPYSDGLVYVERQPGALAAYFAQPGQEPRQVAVVQQEGVGQPGYPFWGAVTGPKLILAVEGIRARAVDLPTGVVTELGDEAIPLFRGELALSPNRRYLAYKTANRGDEVRVLDLETGMVFRPSDDAHLPGIAWSRSGGQWAVLAAEPGSGLPVTVGANLEMGATHVDVGTVKGGLIHLTPPEPLTLLEGPWWSPDGQQLALVEGDPRDPARPHSLWLVGVAENEWNRLGRLPDPAYVGGFMPDGKSLAVTSQSGLELWPVTGEEPTPVAEPWLIGENSPAALPGGGLVYLTAEPEPRVLYQKPSGGDPVLLVVEKGPKGPPSLGSSYGAVPIYRDGPVHDLLLFPLPR